MSESLKMSVLLKWQNLNKEKNHLLWVVACRQKWEPIYLPPSHARCIQGIWAEDQWSLLLGYFSVSWTQIAHSDLTKIKLDNKKKHLKIWFMAGSWSECEMIWPAVPNFVFPYLQLHYAPHLQGNSLSLQYRPTYEWNISTKHERKQDIKQRFRNYYLLLVFTSILLPTDYLPMLAKLAIDTYHRWDKITSSPRWRRIIFYGKKSFLQHDAHQNVSIYLVCRFLLFHFSKKWLFICIKVWINTWWQTIRKPTSSHEEMLHRNSVTGAWSCLQWNLQLSHSNVSSVRNIKK